MLIISDYGLTMHIFKRLLINTFMKQLKLISLFKCVICNKGDALYKTCQVQNPICA